VSLIIDILILAIILIAVIVGYKKGFIKISVTAIGLILSFVLSITLSSMAAEWTYNSFIQEKMVSNVSAGLERQGNVAIDTAIDNLFSSDKMIIKMAKICDITADDIKPEISSDSQEVITVAEYIEKEVIRPTLTFMLRLIVMILLFILLSILFNLLSNLLSKTFSLTVAKKADPVLGGFLGLVLGIVFAFLLCILLDTAISLFPDGFIGLTEETRDGSYLYRLINYVSSWNI